MKNTKAKTIQHKIIQEKKNVVNQIITMYPALKKDKRKIMDDILSDKEPQSTIIDNVFEIFQIKGKTYFRDNNDWIWENIAPNECKIVGAYRIINNLYAYYFFNRISIYMCPIT